MLGVMEPRAPRIPINWRLFPLRLGDVSTGVTDESWVRHLIDSFTCIFDSHRRRERVYLWQEGILQWERVLVIVFPRHQAEITFGRQLMRVIAIRRHTIHKLFTYYSHTFHILFTYYSHTIPWSRDIYVNVLSAIVTSSATSQMSWNACCVRRGPVGEWITRAGRRFQ
jgi:hypothetical protein